MMTTHNDTKNQTENDTANETGNFGPLILALEASGAHASAAVIQDGTVLAEMRLDQAHGHASNFVTLAHDCLKEAGLGFADISHVAAGIGPGSFTGLRVCLSAAKGFVLAGDLVGIGVHGLRAGALAGQEQGAKGVLIACADTRRGVYFYQSYDESLTALDEIKEGTQEEIISFADGRTVLFPSFVGNLIETAFLAEMSARHIGLLADRDIRDGARLLPLDALYVAEPKLGPSKKMPNQMPNQMPKG